jgi:hypothetical protein
MNLTQAQMAQELNCSQRTIRRYLVEAKRRKLAIVKGSTAADMLANALFHAGHVRAELLRTYYEARNSGDRPSVLRALSELRQHSTDEIALLERAGALDRAVAPKDVADVERTRWTGAVDPGCVKTPRFI